MKKELERKLVQAKTKLVCEQPFVTAIAMRLNWIEDENLFPPTMATDGKRLLYHPGFVEKCSLDELVGVIGHEAFHVAGKHPWRRDERDPQGWNIACDMTVNGLCGESGLTLPEDGVPGNEHSAEQNYEELLQDQKDGSGGQGVDWGQVIDPEGKMTRSEREQAMQDVDTMVRAAAQAAERAGKLPAGIKRWLKDLLEPIVPWDEILARFVDEHNREDYSWLRANRRFSGGDFIMPTMHADEPAKIVMACDTSGSIDAKTLQRIGSEVMWCMARYETDPEMLVLWCDYNVYAQIVDAPEQLSPQGGGGTSFAPAFRYLLEHDVQTKAVVYVTDGWCGEFGEEPECDVLWVLTIRNREFQPPFGEIAFCLEDA